LGKKITFNSILELQYKKLLSASYVPEGDQTAIISESINTIHDSVYFLYGKFLRLASPMDLTRFKPTTLAALNTETVDELIESHDGDVFDIMLTEKSISNIKTRIQARYEEVIMMAAISMCECDYSAIPYQGEIIPVPEEFNKVLEKLTSSFTQNLHHSEVYLFTFLSELEQLNQSGDKHLEIVTDMFLTIFRDLILNFFISFASVLETSWGFEYFDYQSRYSKLSPKAFVSKIFFDLEKAYLYFFTRKFKEEHLEFSNPNEKDFINYSTLHFIENIKPVKIDKTFLATIEARFTELVTPLVFKHIIVPRTNHDNFLEKLRDIKIYYSLQAFEQMQVFLDTNASIDPQSINTFISNTLTDPTQIPRKKKKNKKNRHRLERQSQSDISTRNTTTSDHTSETRSNCDPVITAVTILDILDIQKDYYHNLELVNASKKQLELLIKLNEDLEQCLGFQEGIASPEVLDWFYKSYKKANKIKPVHDSRVSLDSEFTDLLGNCDLSQLNPENKEAALHEVNKIENELTRTSFQINKLQSGINSKLQTLDIVIKRIFRDTIDEVATLDEPVDSFETEENTDYQYIKSAFGNNNPRFERLSKVEGFIRILGLRIATGGKHLAIYRGDVKICALALTTIQEGKLYMKEFVAELYRDHGMDKDLLHDAIRTYLK